MKASIGHGPFAWFVRAAIAACILSALAACGGGGASDTDTTTSAVASAGGAAPHAVQGTASAVANQPTHQGGRASRLAVTAGATPEPIYNTLGSGTFCQTTGTGTAARFSCSGSRIGRNFLGESAFGLAPSNRASAAQFFVPFSQTYLLDKIEVPLYLVPGSLSSPTTITAYVMDSGVDGLPLNVVFTGQIPGASVQRILFGVQPAVVSLSGISSSQPVALIGNRKYWLVLAIAAPVSAVTSEVQWAANVGQPATGLVTGRQLDQGTGTMVESQPWLAPSSSAPAFRISGVPFTPPAEDLAAAIARPGIGVSYIGGGVAVGPTRRNAVVLVHGWNSDPTAWAEAMAVSIRQTIDGRIRQGFFPLEQWDVIVVDWREAADTGLPPSGPPLAYTNAQALGFKLALLLRNKYDYVHFLAHSAGSKLIETASQGLKLSASPPFIHETFLDAYSADIFFADEYGLGANWAEQYVDKRDVRIYQTNETLDFAFNFDITELGRALPLSDPAVCLALAPQYPLCAHAWPYRWYQRTTADPLDWNYGFRLSREFSTLDPPSVRLLGQGHTGQSCAISSADTVCPGDNTSLRKVIQTVPVANAWTTASATSDAVHITQSTTGTVGVSVFGELKLSLGTGSPVWVTLDANVTEQFDSLQFDLKFLSTAEGLLSVFIDDQAVFIADERDRQSGLNSSGRIAVGRVMPGPHRLTFRLDPYAAQQSLVEITNVVTAKSSLIQVENLRPLARAGADSVARSGSTVSLDGRASMDPDGAPQPLVYSWTQTTGPNVPLFGSATPTPTFVPAVSGTYTFALVVNDGQSSSAPALATIVVPIPGDVNGDGVVDTKDVDLIRAALNTAVGPNDVRDINGDGKIDGADVTLLRGTCGAACNRPPIASAGQGQTVECVGPTGATLRLDGSASSDPDGDPISFNWTGPFGAATGVSPTVSLPLGTSKMSLAVSDAYGGTGLSSTSVIVRDTTPPNATLTLTPNVLWSPNHKLVPIIATIKASDLCDPSPQVSLVSITSSQPDSGLDKDDVPGDIQGAAFGTNDSAFLLRSERAGEKAIGLTLAQIWLGRTYTVTYRVTDKSGNSTTVSGTVKVPYSQ